MLEIPIYTSEDDKLFIGMDSHIRAEGNGWAYYSGTGLAVNKAGVQYRIVAEEILPDGSERNPQRVESRVCTVRDLTNAKRGETDILNIKMFYDSADDSLVTYIYGGRAEKPEDYLVRWKYRFWTYGNLGFQYVGFESWELPANDKITVELTDFGAIVRYPGYNMNVPFAQTEPHVRVWDMNGSTMETSIIM